MGINICVFEKPDVFNSEIDEEIWDSDRFVNDTDFFLNYLNTDFCEKYKYNTDYLRPKDFNHMREWILNKKYENKKRYLNLSELIENKGYWIGVW